MGWPREIIIVGEEDIAEESEISVDWFFTNGTYSLSFLVRRHVKIQMYSNNSQTPMAQAGT